MDIYVVFRFLNIMNEAAMNFLVQCILMHIYEHFCCVRGQNWKYWIMRYAHVQFY